MRTSALHEALVRHLESWGLRRFDNDNAYFRWQREILSTHEIQTLHRLIDLKRAPTGDPAAEVAFYDQSAAPQILPILHSQQYDYFQAVGPRVAERIGAARSVLDFGCGIGLLTTYYAGQFPNTAFLGVDRSTASIRAARDHAERLNLPNVRFEDMDIERQELAGSYDYDLIVATHALLQAERDPGLPSRSWRTLERAQDAASQAAFEKRTGLKVRLERLCARLAPHGRLIVFEKSRQLARRAPFQRALAARGFTPLEDPLPIRYALLEDVIEDGPLYVLGRPRTQDSLRRLLVWNEAPEEAEANDLYRCQDAVASKVWDRLPVRIPAWEWEWQDPGLGSLHVESGRCGVLLQYLHVTINGRTRGLLIRLWHEGESFVAGFRRAIESSRRRTTTIADLIEETWPRAAVQEDPELAPLYENHTLSAMEVWAALPDRTIQRERTFTGTDGEEAHIELGTVPSLAYLYFANTFDQRQIVLMERSRIDALKQYYDDLAAGFAQTR